MEAGSVKAAVSGNTTGGEWWPESAMYNTRGIDFMRAEVYGFLGTRVKERGGITHHGVKAVVGLDTGACRFQGGVGSLSDAICPMVTTLPGAEVVMGE